MSESNRQATFRVNPRLALSRQEAAATIGVSLDTFERYVQPELRVVRVGRRRLIPVLELEKWLARSAARVLEDERVAGA